MTGQPPIVGVVGLGAVGSILARKLLREGFEVVANDVRPLESTEPGVRLKPTPKEVAAVSDVVLICVVDERQVRDVLFGPSGLASAGSTRLSVVITSTISHEAVREIGEECDRRGIECIDCGVTLAEDAATAGPVAMVGGSTAAVDRCRPVLDTAMKHAEHCGPRGAGMVAKLARNVLTYGSWTVVAEATRIAATGGVAPDVFLRLVEASDPDGRTLFRWLRMQLAAELTDSRSVRTVALLEKDLTAAAELAAAHDLDTRLVDLIIGRAPNTLAASSPSPLAQGSRTRADQR